MFHIPRRADALRGVRVSAIAADINYSLAVADGALLVRGRG